jgi:hypothetical protein
MPAVLVKGCLQNAPDIQFIVNDQYALFCHEF